MALFILGCLGEIAWQEKGYAAWEHTGNPTSARRIFPVQK